MFGMVPCGPTVILTLSVSHITVRHYQVGGACEQWGPLVEQWVGQERVMDCNVTPVSRNAISVFIPPKRFVRKLTVPPGSENKQEEHANNNNHKEVKQVIFYFF